MSMAAVCMLGLALLLVAVNLNYSLLAMALHRLREGHWPLRLPTGIPLLATLATLLAFHQADGVMAVELLVVLLLADSGGPVWWLAATLRRWRSRRPAKPVALRPRLRPSVRH